MRLFELHRTKIIEGRVSTYAVAEGVEWSDGTVAMRWLGANPSSVTHDSVESVTKIHIHSSGLSGAQSLVWIFEPA